MNAGQAEQAKKDLATAVEKLRLLESSHTELSRKRDYALEAKRSKEETLHQESQKLDTTLRQFGQERESKIRQVETQISEAMSRVEQAFSMRKMTLSREISELEKQSQQLNEQVQQVTRDRHDAERVRTEAMQKVPHVT